MFNGHIDVVDIDPLDEWQHPPFAGTLVDGRVYGRGACDMKGGVASMVFAAEVLTAAGVQLAGELIVNPVSDEESTGAGGLVSARTLRADAAIVTEPTALDVWIACRGSLLATITIPGRSGHAGLPARHPDEGGAVNAIEKLGVILDAIHRLRDEWALRYRHPFLSVPDCVPTIVQGGEWVVSYPSSCRLECHLEYLPEQADDNGWGARVEQEFEEWIARAAAADPWLAVHPPQISWEMGGVPPAQVSVSEPIVTSRSPRSARSGTTTRGSAGWTTGMTGRRSQSRPAFRRSAWALATYGSPTPLRSTFPSPTSSPAPKPWP